MICETAQLKVALFQLLECGAHRSSELMVSLLELDHVA